MLNCNCSIPGDPETREAIVADPGDELERALEILRAPQLNTRTIVSTHTHIDHLGGLSRLFAVPSRAVQALMDGAGPTMHLVYFARSVTRIGGRFRSRLPGV